MKTRIFTTTAMLILVTNLIAGTVDMNQKDSTTILAYAATVSNISEISTGKMGFTTGLNNTIMANVLEEWIANRESWEQEGSDAGTGNNRMESVNLEEWIAEREFWEQESEITKNDLIETVNLEEWIVSRETWEQKGFENEINPISGQADILEPWIFDRENWEQK